MEQEYKYMVATRCFTFNHAPYIEDAMNGFAMQETSFPVFTLIVDDASTDGEPEVIRKYLAEHFQSPYRVEETEYANIICAKHKTNANCDFVVFLLKYNHYSIKKPKLPYLSEWNDKAKYHALCEGDDYWIDPYKLQKQVDFLENNSEYILVHSDFAAFNNSKNIFIHHAARKYKIYNGDVFEHLFEKCFIRTPTVLHRNIPKEIPIQCEPEDMFKGDLYLFYWLSKKGKFYFMDEEMAVYRVLENSASHFTSEEARYIAFEKGRKLDYFIADYYGVDSVIKEKLDAKWFVIDLKSCVRTGNCDYLQKLSSPNDFVQLKYVILYKCCKFPFFLNFVKLLNEYKKFLYKKWF